jgi:hypothetical protein
VKVAMLSPARAHRCSGRLAQILIALAALAWAPRATRGAPIAAIAVGRDLAETRVIGPSGQVYAPDDQGRWIRTTGGGVAADVHSAAISSLGVLVAGIAAPLYHLDLARWHAIRLGQRGKTVLGAGPSIAVGPHVFVLVERRWKRVGSVPGIVAAVWAKSPAQVVVATDRGVFRLQAGAFSRVSPMSARWLAGPGPLAIASRQAVHVATGAQIEFSGDATVAAASAQHAVWIVELPDQRQLLRYRDGRVETTVLPLAQGRPIAAAAVTGSGQVLVATSDGELWSLEGTTWKSVQVVDVLVEKAPGPGPARSP